jgi:hypothetical protein
MSITSMNARMGMAEKLSIPQLTKAVQDGTVPSFIGIPLIQQKMKEKTAAGAMQAQQPPVAQQVLQQAMATEGVQALPSNMPESYAQGGILSYAEGDLIDDEDYDEMMYDDQMSEAQKQIGKIRDEMMANQAAQSAEVPSISPSYGGIDYAESRNPQVEYRRTPTAEVAKVSKGTPSNFESIALARGKAYGVDENLVRHVMHKETGGLKDRANAVSPAGAIGVMQLMPRTAKELGVSDPYNPEQNIEGGVKYLAQLQRKYQDPRLTAIAYNWGPGNTDKWLASGADPSRLPRETRGYIQNLAEGGIAGLAGGGSVKHFQYGGISSVAPFTASGLSVEDLTRMAQMGEQSAIDELATREAKAARTLKDAQTGRAGINPNYRATPTPNYVNPQAARVAAPVAGASPSFMEAAGSALKKFNPRALTGIGTLFHTQDLNANEEEELKKRWANAKPPAPAVSPANEQSRLAQIYADQRALGNTSLGKDKPMEPMDIGFGMGKFMPDTEKKAEEAPAVEASTNTNEVEEIKNLLKQKGEGLSKQRDIDNYMALLSAGLGMMGGTSPFAGANIGTGAQQGVNYALQAGRGRAADENALLSGRLGLYKYQQAAEANKMNKEYLQDYRKENIRLKDVGLTDARNRAASEQELKRLTLHKDRLSALERSANAIALSRLKTGFTDAEKEKAIADSIARLHNDPGYQEDYRAIYGRLPYSAQASTQNVRKFDNKFGK